MNGFKITDGAGISSYPAHFVRFLGTAGTRFVMLSQRRASGGMWFSYGDAHGVIDPGPGALVQICAARPELDLTKANTIILTHKHIDHSCDVNVMIEGMTVGSREPKGMALITRDCLDKGDCVLLSYAAKKLERMKYHKENKNRRLWGDTTIESVSHMHHGVQCFGAVFRSVGLPTWGIISDTSYIPTLADRYDECEMLIINCAMADNKRPIDHMSLPDVAKLLKKIHPAKVLLTHMGRAILDMDPDMITERYSTDRTQVVPARDGMIVEIG